MRSAWLKTDVISSPAALRFDTGTVFPRMVATAKREERGMKSTWEPRNICALTKRVILARLRRRVGGKVASCKQNSQVLTRNNRTEFVDKLLAPSRVKGANMPAIPYA